MRSISVETSAVTFPAGTEQELVINVTPLGPTVALSADGVPPGWNVSFEPRVVAPGLTRSVMKIMAGPAGSATVTIRASSDGGSGVVTHGTATVSVSVGCPGYAVPTDCPPFPTGGNLSVTGIVRERTAEGLRPVSGVDVWVWVQRATNGYAGGRVMSGADGSYTHPLLPVSLAVFQAFGGGWDQPCGAVLEVNGTGQTMDIEVVSDRKPIYDPNPQAPGLTGVIYERTAEGRRPLPGARVWLEGLMEIYTNTTTTDDQGRFSLCRIPGITKWVNVWKDGYNTLLQPVTISGVTVAEFEITKK